ncbi:Hypothetical protein SCF082_LOCUS15059 [Durusdinium trenchii]|uniref:Ubiquitin-like domain-containing protein n=1 Tax=Durusdinium trenchii TaxID=1381693 RepID=A0ABP0K3E2_9DINO
MDDYHEMELSRRSIQISDLRDDLLFHRDRHQEAEDRTAQLERQMAKQKAEMAIRKAAAQEMEAQAAADQAFCLENQRLIQEDEEAAEAETTRLREAVAKASELLQKAQVQAVEAEKAAEAAKEQAKARAEEHAHHALQRGALEAAIATATEEMEKVQEKIRELEFGLEVERKASEELQGQVELAEEKVQQTQGECDRLSQILESLSCRAKEDLRRALEATQREQMRLTQEVAQKQRDLLLQSQSIQGRLDETKRQIQQTRQTAVPSLPGAATSAALDEEKAKADAAKERRLELEVEVKDLEQTLSQLQALPPRSAALNTASGLESHDARLGAKEVHAAADRVPVAQPAAPLSVTVRAMYFSNDGSQADTGAQVTLQLSTSSTVEELLNSTREALGGSSRARGRLLFRMRPLKDLEATLEMCGVHRDPSGLHFLMERKHRPQEVVQKAHLEAQELSVAMALAAAEANARPKRRKKKVVEEVDVAEEVEELS